MYFSLWKGTFSNFVDLNLKTHFHCGESVYAWFRGFAAVSLLSETDIEEVNQYLRLAKSLLYQK